MSYLAEAICPRCGSTKQSVTVGFAEAISGLEEEFPILALALQDVVPAMSTVIEWIHGGGSFLNYTQIMRTPFGQTGTEKASRLYNAKSIEDLEEDALRRHLGSIEEMLTYGEPSRTATQVVGYTYTCGGVRWFLDRMPRKGDSLKLRPLRDLTLLPNRQASDADRVEHEWISEVSLQVMRG